MYVEHLRIPVGPGALHIERLGRGGRPVVLLHGFGTCTFLWRRLSPALAAAGYTSIAIDLLGHGESDRPADGVYTIGAQADHVARAMAALRLPSACIVGQDIGGLVALLLAASPRSRVEAVGLLSPIDPDDLPGPDIRALQRSAGLLAFGGNTLFGAQPALAPILQSGVTSPSRMPDLLVARYLAPFVGSDGLNQLMQRAAAVEWSDDDRLRLSDITAPVLVVEGAADPSRPTREWQPLLPSTEVQQHRLEGSGRLIPEDAPESLQRLILEWLSSQRND